MRQVSRRRFYFAATALLIAQLALAQTRSTGKRFRVGLFPDLDEPWLGWMHEAMQSAGFRQGRDYAFVESGASYGEPTGAAVHRLMGLGIDLVLVNSTAHAIAARQVSTRLPIVMWGSGFPVEAGVALSLARPGKNVTGVSAYAGTGVFGKLLELLREAKPGISRVGVAWGYVPPMFPRQEIEPFFREIRQFARALGLGLHIEEIASSEAVQAGLASLETARPDALLVTAGPGFYSERHRVLQFALAKRIPTVVDWRWPPGDSLQPLLTYGAIFSDSMRQAANYVVRILRDSAHPGELPIQLPSKFELVVNRRTANAIGLTIPQALLVRADEVVE